MFARKSAMGVFCVVLLYLLTACGKTPSEGIVTTKVTWDELLEANRLKAVLEQGGFCSVTKDDEGDVYLSYAVISDGELVYSTGTKDHTRDLCGGIIYNAWDDEKDITIIAPNADMTELIDNAYGEELSSYQVPEKIYANEKQYYAKLYRKEGEWGAIIEGYACFDAETLLLDRMELTLKLGVYQIKQSISMSYHVGEDIALSSYERVVNTQDTVDATIHYPDGTKKEITIDRNTDICVYYPDHQEQWSVCWDEACTGSVDDLGWITDGHGDLYLCKGDVASAPPALSRVMEKSSFGTMFRDNYGTYFQRVDIMDRDENVTQTRELAWYVDEDDGLCLNFEIKDAEYRVIYAARARDNAWYSWTREDGYAVDFFDEFSYAEEMISEYRVFLREEHLAAPMERLEEYAPYYIPYEETKADGMRSTYRYWIHPDADYIEWIELIHNDSAGNVVGYEHCYIGGNGPVPGDLDVVQEVTAPAQVPAIRLTVVSPAGEQLYLIRKDAEISWKGEAMYSDEACISAVTDLKWVNSREAKVYVR